MEAKEDNVLKYSVYTVLYANDVTCNILFRELNDFIPSSDKEAKKIYGALMKRVKHYLRMIENIVGDKSIWFYSDFNSFMDEKTRDNIDNLTNAIKLIFKEKEIENYEFLAKLYVACCFFELAISNCDYIVKKLKSLNIDSGCLASYSIKEMQKIVSNLYVWCFRKVEIDIDLNNYQEIIDLTTKMTEDLLDYSTFEFSYNSAIIEQN